MSSISPPPFVVPGMPISWDSWYASVAFHELKLVFVPTKKHHLSFLNSSSTSHSLKISCIIYHL